MNQLTTYTTQEGSRDVMLSPSRTRRFIGRTALLREIVDTLRTARTGWYAITGMPGVGKSALAYEALRLVTTNDREGLPVFPDGMEAFSGTGRRGLPGLMALLQEIIAAFEPLSAPLGDTGETDLARLIAHTRNALAGKRVLLLLDDLDAQFPLRQAWEALFAHDKLNTIDCHSCIVLATSSYRPSPALVTRHFHVGPMDAGEAGELFAALLGHLLYSVERDYAEQVCAAVGYLPLAIEAAATAVATTGVPLSLLAQHAEHHPLDRLVDGEGEIRAVLEKALEEFDPELQSRFALLATLGIRSFALESASAIIASPTPGQAIGQTAGRDQSRPYEPSPNNLEDLEGTNIARTGVIDHTLGEAGEQLARTAADLGQLVRHSVIELLPYDPSTAFTPSDTSVMLLPQAMTSPTCDDHLYRTRSTRYQLHPLFFVHAMERLNQLEPEVVRAARRSVQAYAACYVERYRGDVPLLERERDFLLATLAQAWDEEQYADIIRLTEGLAYLAGRLSNPEQGKQMLLRGIEACLHTHDQHHLAYFLNRLVGLHLSCGEYAEAFQTWKESIAIANQLGRPAYLWEPLCNLVYIADMIGSDAPGPYNSAQRFAETLLLAQDHNDPSSIAAVLFIRGYFARHAGERERAYEDLSACLHMLSAQQQTGNPLYQRFFELEVQTELARLQGNYPLSREYTEATIALAQVFCDPYTVAELVIDQAIFALQQGKADELNIWVLRLTELVQPLKAPHLHQSITFLLEQASLSSTDRVIESTPLDVTFSTAENRSLRVGNTSPSVCLPFNESLSQRELDVLQLLATGLSNYEVATQLFVTTSTVKKHLEHIYNKLDVHTRTQAIARARAVGLLV